MCSKTHARLSQHPELYRHGKEQDRVPDSHVRTLRLSMDQHVHTNTLLLLDGICHVLIHLPLIVSITELTLLVGKTSTSDGCSTTSACIAVPQKWVVLTEMHGQSQGTQWFVPQLRIHMSCRLVQKQHCMAANRSLHTGRGIQRHLSHSHKASH